MAAGLLVSAGVGLASYRFEYDVWPWSTYPSELNVCGQTFVPLDAPETRAQITHEGFRMFRFGDVPGWFNDEEIWTYDLLHGKPIGPWGEPCRDIVWVRGGPDAYRSYNIPSG